ncbi:hypothetical protein ABH924_003721 [Arthrobacter sp. GAS37]|uniref:hypothetical protein n=1 Tax=Arthrobacter sp. GAS37 TaxID=3156261 RepID=UPI0038338420
MLFRRRTSKTADRSLVQQGRPPEASNRGRDVVTIAVNAAVLASTEILAQGICPRPQVHLFFDGEQTSYDGFVVCRPYYPGADAMSAISELGTLAASLYATRVMVVWEEADLQCSLAIPGNHAMALTTLTADYTNHELVRRPLTPAHEVSPTGLIGAVPGGRPETSTNTRLPAPIAQLLSNWRSLDGPHVETIVGQMQSAGYEFVFRPR